MTNYYLIKIKNENAHQCSTVYAENSEKFIAFRFYKLIVIREKYCLGISIKTIICTIARRRNITMKVSLKIQTTF